MGSNPTPSAELLGRGIVHVVATQDIFLCLVRAASHGASREWLCCIVSRLSLLCPAMKDTRTTMKRVIRMSKEVLALTSARSLQETFMFA